MGSWNRAVLGVAVVWSAVPGSAQSPLLERLRDARQCGPVLRELLGAAGPAAIERLVDAYAATPNTQRGLEQRRCAVAALDAVASRNAAALTVIPALAAALDDADEPRRIEAILVALGALVPRSLDRAVCDRAIQAAERNALRLWHANEQRWTSGDMSTPLIEGFRAIVQMQVSIHAPRDRLETLLRGPDPLLRECAAERLAGHGEAALPALRAALGDDHPDRVRGGRGHLSIDGNRIVPVAAWRSIARIDSNDRDATTGLMWIARYGLGHERLMAIAKLGNPALEDPWRVVHALIPIALGSDDRLAIEAIAALGALGPSARPAITALERLVADERDGRGGRAAPAAAALRRIRGR